MTRRLARTTIAALLIATAGSAWAAPAGASPARTIRVTGHWLDSEPLTLTGITDLGAGAVITATGSSSWSGSLTGTTTYRISAFVTVGGTATGTIEETFDGTIATVGPSELRFTETFTQLPGGAIDIIAVALAGSDQPLRGLVNFTGVTDQSGVGGGTYSGFLVTQALSAKQHGDLFTVSARRLSGGTTDA